MKRVAFLIPGTHGSAFYSQIAALAAAVRQLPWTRWTPTIHVVLGPADDADSSVQGMRRWAPFLDDVEIVDVDAGTHAAIGNWAQSDAALERAPAEADALVCLDADTFPAAGFEDVLEKVDADDLVAGVMAHYPPPGVPTREAWLRLADGLLTTPLSFAHEYSLVEARHPLQGRAAPFYVNGGVMLFARRAFDRFLPVYLGMRRTLIQRMEHEAFTGQVAAAMAIAEARLSTASLPMRYNFPNDPAAARLHPDEAPRVVIHHYLRTGRFNRHRIFTAADQYARFLEMPLDGPDATFRAAVTRVLGERYPFDGRR